MDAHRAQEIGRLAAVDPPAASNPRPVDAEALGRVFAGAVEGRL